MMPEDLGSVGTCAVHAEPRFYFHHVLKGGTQVCARPKKEKETTHVRTREWHKYVRSDGGGVAAACTRTRDTLRVASGISMLWLSSWHLSQSRLLLATTNKQPP
jgi:hypothetical protein